MNIYFTCRFKQTRFENVGEMLALRKELFRKRRTINDIAFITALVGIILMIIHTELRDHYKDDDDMVASIYDNTKPAAIVLKVFITISTVILIGMVVWFHLIDVKVSQILICSTQ